MATLYGTWNIIIQKALICLLKIVQLVKGHSMALKNEMESEIQRWSWFCSDLYLHRCQEVILHPRQARLGSMQENGLHSFHIKLPSLHLHPLTTQESPGLFVRNTNNYSKR